MTPTDARIGERFDQIVEQMKLADELPAEERPSPGARRRQRGFSPQDYSGLATLSLVNEKGILRFVYQPPARGPAAGRRRRASRVVGAEPIREVSFRETPPNRVIEELESFDKKLTPNQGLRRLQPNGTFAPAQNAAIKGRVLLLVHGTFSKSDMFVDELGAIAAGKAFLGKAANVYEAILAFDHPTLSVSPWINALDLEDALAGVSGPIDVICHSRGGLVVAWWLRNAKRKVDNVVFVGSPLEGTSLASPAKLRAALQGLANFFKALEMAGSLASTVVPLMSIVTGIAKICGGILQLGASSPLADAAVAIVPGLASQSRVSNNAELVRLTRSAWVSTPAFHAVTSNFEPAETDAQWWQVWKLFRNPKDKLLNAGADKIFQNSNNDLVVDTGSMTIVCGKAIDPNRILHFGDSKTVHHCNYFRQDETVRHLSKALKL